MHSLSATPFSLPLPKESETGLTTSWSKHYDINGIARFDGQQLVLEWSGRARISEVGMTTSRRLEEAIPSGSCAIPVIELSSAMLRGRWWRPRLEITAASLASVADVPGSRGARVVLWLSRHDWPLAQELCSELRLAMAEAALQSATQQAGLSAPDMLRPSLDSGPAAAGELTARVRPAPGIVGREAPERTDALEREA